MYIAITQSDPEKAIKELYPADKYEIIDSIISLADSVLVRNNSYSDPDEEISLNHWLWGDNLSTACLYGMMIGATLQERNSLTQKVTRLETLMTLAAKDIRNDQKPWPDWIYCEPFLVASRGYLKMRRPEWYKQFDWYDSVKFHAAPIPGVSYGRQTWGKK